MPDYPMNAMNSNDAAYMKQAGGIDINRTTVRQFFEQQGIDVDGPLSQLRRLASGAGGQGQAAQMGQMAQRGNPPQGPGVSPSGPPREEPNMESLMSKMR